MAIFARMLSTDAVHTKTLPYQTLVSSVLHKYAAGRLKEV